MGHSMAGNGPHSSILHVYVIVYLNALAHNISKISWGLPKGIGIDHAECCDGNLPDLLDCLCPDQRDNLGEQVSGVELTAPTAIQ